MKLFALISVWLGLHRSVIIKRLQPKNPMVKKLYKIQGEFFISIKGTCTYTFNPSISWGAEIAFRRQWIGLCPNKPLITSLKTTELQHRETQCCGCSAEIYFKSILAFFFHAVFFCSSYRLSTSYQRLLSIACVWRRSLTVTLFMSNHVFPSTTGRNGSSPTTTYKL